MTTKTWVLIITGAFIGLLAFILTWQGNPPNMGVCVACFLRDTAGGLKLQNAPPVQYMRPEIFGFAIGAFIMALAFKEFRPTAGSSPIVRFTLGFFMMIGCLVFLGCPLRMLLRIAGGDLNAIVGLVGLTVGIFIGTLFLKKDFALPANKSQAKIEGLLFPAICIALLALVLFKSAIFAASPAGPGSQHAPILYALAAGLIVGALVERTRFCTIGFISHIFLFKRFTMLFAAIALVLVVFAGDLVLGKFKLGFDMQPIAHADGLWNFLSMTLVGLCGVFLSGCPLRQIVKAGHGDGDSAVAVFGMLIGASIAHNFALASAAQSANSAGGPTLGGKIFVIIGIAIALLVGLAYSAKTTQKPVTAAST